MLTMIRGPKRSTRYEVNGNNPVCEMTKIVNAQETFVRVVPRSSLSGVVNCVQAYCRLAIATIANMQATNTNHRDLPRTAPCSSVICFPSPPKLFPQQDT